MASKPIKIIAVLPVHNRKYVTLSCLAKLSSLHFDSTVLDVVLVDDGSTDGTGISVKNSFPKTIILTGDGNLWWAGGVNKGLKYIENNFSCDYILLLNNDTNFSSSSLKRLVGVINKSDELVVCSAVVIDEESGKILNMGQKVTGRLKELKPLLKGSSLAEYQSNTIECDSVGSRFVLMPKRIIRDIGYFDQHKFVHGYSDLEYFFRAKKKGYKILIVTKSIVSTKQNRNYLKYRIIDQSVFNYLKSFFNVKYSNNLKQIFYESLSHKNIFLGIILFMKKIFSNSKWIIYKLFLSERKLQDLVDQKWSI